MFGYGVSIAQLGDYSNLVVMTVTQLQHGSKPVKTDRENKENDILNVKRKMQAENGIRWMWHDSKFTSLSINLN